MDKQMRQLTLLFATMGMALVLSAGAAVALTLACTAGRGCVGTDDYDTLNGSIGNDDMDGRQQTSSSATKATTGCKAMPMRQPTPQRTAMTVSLAKPASMEWLATVAMI